MMRLAMERLGVDEVVLRTLEKEPERRYQYASAIKSDVERIASDRKLPRRPAAEQIFVNEQGEIEGLF